MIAKRLKITSLALQGVYFAACILEIVFCLVYKNNYTTGFGAACADIALWLICGLISVPAE